MVGNNQLSGRAQAFDVMQLIADQPQPAQQPQIKTKGTGNKTAGAARLLRHGNHVEHRKHDQRQAQRSCTESAKAQRRRGQAPGSRAAQALPGGKGFDQRVRRHSPSISSNRSLRQTSAATNTRGTSPSFSATPAFTSPRSAA